MEFNPQHCVLFRHNLTKSNLKMCFKPRWRFFGEALIYVYSIVTHGLWYFLEPKEENVKGKVGEDICIN